MAHEAFALSPISARAASPTDADFEAIRDAFAETARGRWFLDEYAKRNRNADTAMVLEAVARIEQSLAAQKEEQQRTASEPQTEDNAPNELPTNPLPEAMAAVRAIVAAARESASSVLAVAAFEDMLAPSRKCARVIREIAWGLRESGADGRICALLDLQVDAINAACDQIAAGDVRDGVLRAFDQVALEIEGIAQAATEPQAAPEPVVVANVVVDFRPRPEAIQSAVAEDEIPETTIVFEVSQPATTTELALSPEDVPPEVIETSISAEAVSEALTTTHPDVVDETKIERVAEISSEPVVAAPVSTLGESLIANGIIANTISPRSDPLAPIRRMSQAEKIAFFS